ncbi:MAG: extracellular solute-binding protein, partial [Cellvibrionales bacterium]|nr:extracellular solute-binding protein [Cellvibrionales bacterium]
MRHFCPAILLALTLLAPPATAETLRVAVAANFTPTMRQLAADFEQQTGHSVELITASSGKLATQIMQGLDPDLFLSADARRPQQL